MPSDEVSTSEPIGFASVSNRFRTANHPGSANIRHRSTIRAASRWVCDVLAVWNIRDASACDRGRTSVRTLASAPPRHSAASAGLQGPDSRVEVTMYVSATNSASPAAGTTHVSM